MPEAKLSRGLLVLIGVMIALSVCTLIPYRGASQINDLGYYSLCSFTPWSTILLLFVAGMAWVIRQYLQDQTKRSAEAKKS
jgi:hypothetical protein